MEEFTAKVTAVIHHHDIGYYGNQDCITTSILKKHPEMLENHKKAAAQNKSKSLCCIYRTF